MGGRLTHDKIIRREPLVYVTGTFISILREEHECLWPRLALKDAVCQVQFFLSHAACVPGRIRQDSAKIYYAVHWLVCSLVSLKENIWQTQNHILQRTSQYMVRSDLGKILNAFCCGNHVFYKLSTCIIDLSLFVSSPREYVWNTKINLNESWILSVRNPYRQSNSACQRSKLESGGQQARRERCCVTFYRRSFWRQCYGTSSGVKSKGSGGLSSTNLSLRWMKDKSSWSPHKPDFGKLLDVVHKKHTRLCFSVALPALNFFNFFWGEGEIFWL